VAGIHNGARGILKAWQLSERDEATLKQQSCDEVILQDLPKYLFLEMQTPMKEDYPGVPKKWFPMATVTKYWCLDTDGSIDICRRGFPLVPDFATTIDAATGQTLSSALPDLGDEFSTPSQYAGMRGYIALSRVTSADALLIAQPFNPLLFRSGKQSFPALLFDVLMGRVPLAELKLKCEEAVAESKTTGALKDSRWECACCEQSFHWTGYYRVTPDREGARQWYRRFSKYILRPGCLRMCVDCRRQRGEGLESDGDGVETAVTTFECAAATRRRLRMHTQAACGITGAMPHAGLFARAAR
jgi:hypothetical protein